MNLTVYGLILQDKHNIKVVSGRKTGDRSEKFIDSKEVIRGCSSKDSQNSSLRKRDMKKQITVVKILERKSE